MQKRFFEVVMLILYELRCQLRVLFPSVSLVDIVSYQIEGHEKGLLRLLQSYFQFWMRSF